MKAYNFFLWVSVCGFVAVFSTGCATVTRGTTESFVLETEPSGATASLSTGEMCVTPCNLLKKHKDEFSVHVEKEGFEPVDLQVRSQIVGAGGAGLAGNVLVGGVIGLGVDAISGAAKGLVPNPAKLTLVPMEHEEDTVGVDSDSKECPYCGEHIKVAAVLCRYCNSHLPEPNKAITPEPTKENIPAPAETLPPDQSEQYKADEQKT